MSEHKLAKPSPACVETIDQRSRALVEVASDRVARLAKPVGGRVGLSADRLDSLGASRMDAANDVVRVAVQGAAHRLGNVAKTCSDQVAVRIDLVRSFGQSPRQRVPMGAQRLNRVGAAGVDPANDIVAMSAGSGASLDGRRGQAHGDGIPLSADRLQDLFATGVDPANDIVSVSAESASHGERRVRKLRRHILLMRLDRVHGLRTGRGDAPDDIVGVGADRAGHRRRSLGELRRHVVSASLDRIDGLRTGRGDAINDLVGVGADGVARLVRGLGQAEGDPAAMEPDRVDDLGAAVADAPYNLVGVRSDGVGHQKRGLRQLIRGGVAVPPDRLDGPGAAFVDAADDIVGMDADHAAHRNGGLRESRGDPIAVRSDRIDNGGLRIIHAGDQVVASGGHVEQERVRRRFHAVVDVADPLQNVVGCLPAGVREPGGHGFADAGDRNCELRPFGCEAFDGRGPGPVHGDGDLLGRFAERGGDAPAGFGQSLAQAQARGIQILDDAAMRVDDDVADTPAAGHDRLPLIGHFRDQRPNPAFAVGVGALERRHLRLHPRFELGSPGDRPFDAVSHGGQFAADRLRQGRDMIAGRRLWLGQTHRDLGDRARRLAQFAQTSGESGKSKHEKDRTKSRQRQQRRFRTQQRLFQRSRDDRGPKVLVAVKRADRRPNQRSDHRQDEWGAAGRTRIHGLQDRADRLAVVIGRRGRGERRFRLGLTDGGCERSRTRAQKRRRLRAGRRRFEHRRQDGGLRRGNGRRGGRRVAWAEVVVVREVQRAFDRRHRRRHRIRRCVLFCHRIRLASSASIAFGSTNAPTVFAAAASTGERRLLTTLQCTAPPPR